MKLTITLHCEGFRHPCDATLGVSLNPDEGVHTGGFVDLERLNQLSRESRWQVRPVEVKHADGTATTQTQARCPHCANLLADWLASAILAAMADPAARYECDGSAYWWDGEYEGRCELQENHWPLPHWDGVSWFNDDNEPCDYMDTTP